MAAAQVEPFAVVIGPVATSRSAIITRILPADTSRDVDPATVLNRCVRAKRRGSSGLSMPSAAETHWAHHSAAYGLIDTDSPGLAARADDLASALIHQARHHVTAVVSSVWLVWEQQHPARSTYTFERAHHLHLAGPRVSVHGRLEHALVTVPNSSPVAVAQHPVSAR